MDVQMQPATGLAREAHICQWTAACKHMSSNMDLQPRALLYREHCAPVCFSMGQGFPRPPAPGILKRSLRELGHTVGRMGQDNDGLSN